jgi:hypothetical protein
VFSQFGDLERCALRPGNVNSVDGWNDVLKPVARISLSASVRITRGLLLAARTSPRLASVFQASRKSANLPVSSEVIWEIPASLQRTQRNRRVASRQTREQSG